MSIEDKMESAKESHLFDELSEKEKFEAILEGKLKVRLIAELEKIKAEVDEPMRDTTESYGRGYACAMFKCLDILDKHIKELKGENNA